MPTPTQIATEMYQRMRPRAVLEYQQHFIVRTPPDLQSAMATLVAGDVTVSNGQSVRVNNAAGTQVAGSPGSAEVAAGALTDVKLTV